MKVIGLQLNLFQQNFVEVAKAKIIKLQQQKNSIFKHTCANNAAVELVDGGLSNLVAEDVALKALRAANADFFDSLSLGVSANFTTIGFEQP